MEPVPRLPCNCGQTGCVDTLCGARGLERLHVYLHAETLDSRTIVDACVRGGADRIEACACPDIGGVTPSRGMLRALSGSPLPALDRAVALGMGRVLASGGRARAIEGGAVLGAMVERAAGRVQVVAGGGLDAGDIEPLFRLAGVRAFHGSCRGVRPADPLLHRLGFCAAQDRVCDASRVAAFRAAIDRACHPLRPRRSPRRRSAPRCR